MESLAIQYKFFHKVLLLVHILVVVFIYWVLTHTPITHIGGCLFIRKNPLIFTFFYSSTFSHLLTLMLWKMFYLSCQNGEIRGENVCRCDFHPKNCTPKNRRVNWSETKMTIEYQDTKKRISNTTMVVNSLFQLKWLPRVFFFAF